VAWDEVGGPGGETPPLPSAEIAGSKLLLFAAPPVGSTLTCRVTPVRRSCTKTSAAKLVSPRPSAVGVKATKRPSAEMDGFQLDPEAGAPPGAADTRVVTPARRSRT
jgi:hypothetical protein